MNPLFKFLIFGCLLLQVYPLPAQVQVSDTDGVVSYRPLRANQLKLSLLRLVDPFNPGIELAYERGYNKRFSTLIAVGYQKAMLNWAELDHYSGMRYMVEQKYYLSPIHTWREQPTYRYAAVELVHLHAQENKTFDFVKDDGVTETWYRDDEYTEYKRTTSLNIRFGLQRVRGRFVADISAGLGIKYKSIKTTGVDNPDAKLYYVHDVFGLHRTGQHDFITFNIPFLVRLGYVF